MKKKVPGLFITFEGIEGCGKSTQAKKLKEYLESQSYPVLLTREPGGSQIGEKIRSILTDTGSGEMLALTEALLFSAARYQHIHQVIVPALEEGMIVLSDRFLDATLAYQGYGRKVPLEVIQQLNSLVTWGIQPDLTLFLDVDYLEGVKRSHVRYLEEKTSPDRFESEEEEFFSRVREGYLRLVQEEPERIKMVDARAEEEAVHSRILELLRESLQKYGPPSRLSF